MDNIQRHQDSTPVMIAADTTLNAIIDSKTNLNNGTLDAVFNFVTASNFTSTQNGIGKNFQIGDDCYIGDVNKSNTLGITGIQDATQGYVKFGSSGPIVGFASTAALPAAGTAITGSLIQKNGSLYFYNGTSGNGGWSTVI